MSVLQFHHVVVIADKRTMNHLNLEGGPKFVSKVVDSADDLAELKLTSLDNIKAVFIGTGNYDASEACKGNAASQRAKMQNYQVKLQTFFNRNQQLLAESNLVFIKPRVKKEYNPMEKSVFASYIGAAYQQFLQVNPTTTLLSMDKKPELVNRQYKVLYKNLFANPAPSKQPAARPRTPSSSSSSSSEKRIITPEPVMPSRLITGRYNLYFKGFDFVSECEIECRQKGVLIGETEKYSKKDNQKNAWFSEPIAVDFNDDPLAQNLEFTFGNWGHLNITISNIMQQEMFKINAFKKNVYASRVSIIALARDSSKTEVTVRGDNFAKMDTFGNTDAFFKLYCTDTKTGDQMCMYTSETVDNDLSPQFKTFTLVDDRFDLSRTNLEFEFYDADTMTKKYMGRFSVPYTKVKHAKAGEIYDIKNDKSATVGNVVFISKHEGAATNYVPSSSQRRTRNYRIYLSARDLEKTTNQISWALNGAKPSKNNKTEKLSKTNNPAFAQYMELDQIDQEGNFNITFANSNKEVTTVVWQELLPFKNQAVECPFGEKSNKDGTIPHLIMTLVEQEDDEQWTFEVEAHDLPKMDSGLEGGKCDAYFHLSMGDPHTKRYFISKEFKNSLNANWQFSLPAVRVRAEEGTKWTLEFYDKDFNSDDPIGWTQGEVASIMMIGRKSTTRLEQFPGIKDKAVPKDLDKTRISFTRIH